MTAQQMTRFLPLYPNAVRPYLRRSPSSVRSNAQTHQRITWACEPSGRSRAWSSRYNSVACPPKRTLYVAVRTPWTVKPKPVDETISSIVKQRPSTQQTVTGTTCPPARMRATTSTYYLCTRRVLPSVCRYSMLLLSNACLYIVKRTGCGFGVSDRMCTSARRVSKKNTRGQQG